MEETNYPIEHFNKQTAKCPHCGEKMKWTGGMGDFYFGCSTILQYEEGKEFIACRGYWEDQKIFWPSSGEEEWEKMDKYFQSRGWE